MYVKCSKFIVVFAFFIFAWSFFNVSAAQAATLKFDTTTYSVTSGSTIQVQVQVDPASDQITAANAYVLYDPSILQAQTVTPGTYFPSVSNSLGTGKVYIWTTVSDATAYKTGPGTLATITFKAIAGGSSSLTFDCVQAGGDTSKISKNDANGTNVIVCSSNGKATVSTTGSAPVVTSTPAPTAAAATSTYATPTTVQKVASSAALPSTLPQTGAMEDTLRALLLGSFFIFIAGLARVYYKRT